MGCCNGSKQVRPQAAITRQSLPVAPQAAAGQQRVVRQRVVATPKCAVCGRMVSTVNIAGQNWLRCLNVACKHECKA